MTVVLLFLANILWNVTWPISHIIGIRSGKELEGNPMPLMAHVKIALIWMLMILV